MQTDFTWTEWCIAPDPHDLIARFLAEPLRDHSQFFAAFLSGVTDKNSNCSYLVDQFAWLAEFYDTSNPSLANSIAMFNQDPNQMTTILKEYVRRKTCRILVERHLTDEYDGVSQDPSTVLVALDEAGNFWSSSDGQITCQRVSQFCNYFGCHNSSAIYANVDNLQQLARSRRSHQEAYLLSRVEQLTQENTRLKSQKTQHSQIITSIIYRHALEQLCANTHVPYPKNPGRPNTTERWQQFWDNASRSGTRSSPLATLRNDPQLIWAQVRDAGRNLFGTLSANIHQYNEHEYEFDIGEWANAIIVGKVLQAIKPNLQPGAGVDWKTEQGRY
ncbi:uncharacterized protein K460DRAFT_401803 [Cucurbitaria berberidis CBS 394.84]|uniref:Uncharacterized protein n=1 Tax=Cucurbitaria berberidis CBS 394.84 TaxID=1168544 RepID=A0A9P4GU05_9PLEO|nr:uncharacterized protein K460DRAFT_401803 [Cucurbitaria berberidis CBS 394.84]KAF1851792.1 hypothetical protein K460DRAFT_401803 [Cucurbitaria berberidis CBS 394.84]